MSVVFMHADVFIFQSGTETEEYLTKLDEALKVAGHIFDPELVVYNAGTDILDGDPLGRLKVISNILPLQFFIFYFCAFCFLTDHTGEPVTVCANTLYATSMILEVAMACAFVTKDSLLVEIQMIVKYSITIIVTFC